MTGTNVAPMSLTTSGPTNDGQPSSQPPIDLLAATGALIDIPSVSHYEQVIATHLEARLHAVPWLEVHRVGDNLVARTNAGHSSRLLIGGHSDTVPVNGNDQAFFEGDRVYGLGAADMKGGLAVLMALAEHVEHTAVDVTYLIYAREEVAIAHNGLREVLAERPDLLADIDVAILGEPTSALLEAGCQGTMRHKLTLRGQRAHTARAWMGTNAIHRLAAVLTTIAAYEPRRPLIDGCEYHEALQAVFVDGGVAGNVVPDEVTLTIGHRFAPDRSADAAEAHVWETIAPHMTDGDTLERTDLSVGAMPGLNHPLLQSLIARNRLDVKAKLGWTDVAFFAERGIPAANFGPGDAPLAHTQGEWVSRASLDQAYSALFNLLAFGIS